MLISLVLISIHGISVIGILIYRHLQIALLFNVKTRLLKQDGFNSGLGVSHVDPSRRRRFFLELYSGWGRLSGAFLRSGAWYGPTWDIQLGSHLDPHNIGVVRQVCSWISSGRAWYVHLGAPCTRWVSVTPSCSRHRALARASLRFTVYSSGH